MQHIPNAYHMLGSIVSLLFYIHSFIIVIVTFISQMRKLRQGVVN
jgi:hypothetical protein